MKVTSISYDDLYFILFGIPSWILFNGTWASLSQIALVVPEGFKISSYLTVSSMCGNICPFILGNCFLKTASPASLARVINTINTIGLISGLFMAFFWNYSIEISGTLLSVPLFALFFLVGCCSASSNVTHFMFVSHFPSKSTTMLATGMGLGNLIAGLLGLLSGFVFYSLGFSLTYFFILLSFFYLPSLAAFNILAKQSRHDEPFNSIDSLYRSVQTEELLDDLKCASSSLLDDQASYTEGEFLAQYYHLFLLQFLIALCASINQSVVSISCSNFTNRDLILLLCTSLGNTVDPLSRLLTNYIAFSEFYQFVVSAIALLLMTVVMASFAFLPPGSRIFKGEYDFLPVFLYVGFAGMFVFTTTLMFLYLKKVVPRSCAAHAYRWNGISNQCGFALGSLVIFLALISGS